MVLTFSMALYSELYGLDALGGLGLFWILIAGSLMVFFFAWVEFSRLLCEGACSDYWALEPSLFSPSGVFASC
jgi:hypothetical protein